MKEYIRRHKILFALTGALTASILSVCCSLWVLMVWGKPIGTSLQTLGARLIVFAETPQIEMVSPQEEIARITEEANNQLIECKGHLEGERAARARQAREFAQKKGKS